MAKIKADIYINLRELSLNDTQLTQFIIANLTPSLQECSVSQQLGCKVDRRCPLHEVQSFFQPSPQLEHKQIKKKKKNQSVSVCVSVFFLFFFYKRLSGIINDPLLFIHPSIHLSSIPIQSYLGSQICLIPALFCSGLQSITAPLLDTRNISSSSNAQQLSVVLMNS